MLISACLVIRNEDKVLVRCLESLKGVVSEIIVVHDGKCTDKSLEIAHKFRSRVYIRDFVGEAEFHRPFAFGKAKGVWVLNIDADEYLSPGLRKEIGELVKNKTIDAYSFSWPYPGFGNMRRIGPFQQTLKPTLFRKSKMFMVGISHEYPRTYGNLVKRPDMEIMHKPFYDNFTFQVFRAKWLKWARLQATQYRDLDELPVFNIADRKNNRVFLSLKKTFQYPVLTGIFDSLKFIFIYFLRGLLLSGLRSLKIAFLEISYIWVLRFYILNAKYFKEGDK